MSFESPYFEPQSPEHLKSVLSFAEKQELEMKLLEEAEAQGEDVAHWIELYAESFHMIIERNPHLKELYQSDPDACLAYIKKELFTPGEVLH